MKKRPLLLPGLMIICLLLLCRYLPLPQQRDQDQQEWVGRVVGFHRTAKHQLYRIREQQSNKEFLVSYPIQIVSKQSILPNKASHSFLTFSGIKSIPLTSSEKANAKRASDIEPSSYRIGWILRIQGKLRAYEPPGNPGEFDSRRFDVSEGISGRIKPLHTEILRRQTDHPAQALAQIKQWLGQRLANTFPGESGGLLRAMLLADKQGLEAEVNQHFILTGTAHILAVSGLHVSIIGQGVLRLLQRVLPFRAAVVISAGLIVVYAMLIGSGYGVWRAVIMSLLQLAALLLGRRYDPLTALSIAALITVFTRPFCLYSQSFLLSYGAVIAILALPKRPRSQQSKHRQQPRSRARSGRRQLGSQLRNELRQTMKERAVGCITGLSDRLYTALWLYLYLLPLQQHLFANSSLWTPLLNLVVIPLGGAVLLLTCILLPLFWLPLPLLQSLTWPIDLLLTGLLALVEGGSRLPERLVGALNVQRLFIILVGFLILRGWEEVRIRAIKRRQETIRSDRRQEVILDRRGQIGWRLRQIIGHLRRFSYLTLLIAGLIVWWWQPFGSRLRPPQLRYTMLDVGQGDCNLLYTDRKTAVMVDCGSSSKPDVGKRVVANALFTQGIAYLDALFLTHPDADHINGVEGLLDAGIGIGVVFVPPAFASDEEGAALLHRLRERKQEVRQLYRGAVLTVADDGVDKSADKGVDDDADFEDRHTVCPELTITCLAAGEEAKEDSNAMSLVLEVYFGDFSALLTGDLPGEEEEALFRSRKQKTYTVLKAAHHGSRFSTGRLFLERCHFRYAGLSCGADNRYGHPALTVLTALEQEGTECLRTDRQGAISFITDGRRLRVEVYGKE